MDSSQDHGAALHGSSSCQVRCCTVQRPQCALLSAADHPRRTGVERSTSSTSSFIASTGTAAACRRPPAQLRRRADATADHMGPVAVQADLVVPPVSFVGPCVCGYRAFFYYFTEVVVLLTRAQATAPGFSTLWPRCGRRHSHYCAGIRHGRRRRPRHVLWVPTEAAASEGPRPSTTAIACSKPPPQEVGCRPLGGGVL